MSAEYSVCDTAGNCSCYQGAAALCQGGLVTACTSWSFESGTTEGWTLDSVDSGASLGNMTVMAAPQMTNAKALAIHFAQGIGNNLVITVPLCGSNGMQFNSTTQKFSFSLFFMDDATKPAGFMPVDGVQAFHAFIAPGGISMSNVTANVQVTSTNPNGLVTAGTWVDFAAPVFAGDLEATTGIQILVGTSWSGTIFIDNVHF